MKRRLVLTAPAVLALVCLSAGAAFASWTAASSNANGYSEAASLGTPVADNANTTKTATTVHLAWTAPTTGPAPSKYDVKRDGSAVSGCTGIAALSCDDSGLTASTTYHYTVTAKLATNWAGQVALALDVTTPAVDNTAPVLQTLQIFDNNGNGKIDQIRATYDENLNTAFPGTWTVSGLPSGESQGSAVIDSTTPTRVLISINEGSSAPDTSAGSIKVQLASDTSRPRDASGNLVAAIGGSGQAPTDKASPVPTGVSLANGGGATPGIADQKDKVVISYSEGIDTGSFGSCFSSNSLITVTVTDSGNNDRLTVSSSGCTLTIGSVALGANYVTTTATWSGSQSNASSIGFGSGNKLTITLGALASGTPSTTQSPSTPVYTPDTHIADAAGNTMSGTAFTAAATSNF